MTATCASDHTAQPLKGAGCSGESGQEVTVNCAQTQTAWTRQATGKTEYRPCAANPELMVVGQEGGQTGSGGP